VLYCDKASACKREGYVVAGSTEKLG